MDTAYRIRGVALLVSKAAVAWRAMTIYFFI